MGQPQAPAAPTIAAPAQGSQINTPKPRITGTAEPNSTVTVSLNGIEHRVTANNSEAWSYIPEQSLVSASSLKVRATDQAGNVAP
ncbi:Ig-like domain-containing protein [Paenibacillus sp. GCM10012307]|uniref:Bacterial Ig-like domain-containing protein n=1 Tax=Paenibacillus roseus TaxID=2798579 RepID=A0A934MRP1_9BACL|nr:Ig-like domain-containing protein [Paenibacillus roseus]MBJ6362529.1 hypothetical protein [Paenibacillus roseus]